MLLPGIFYFIVFKYIPMYGFIISFQNYKPFKGVSGSEWVGLEHFQAVVYRAGFLDYFKQYVNFICHESLVLFSDSDHFGTHAE